MCRFLPLAVGNYSFGKKNDPSHLNLPLRFKSHTWCLDSQNIYTKEFRVLWGTKFHFNYKENKNE